MKKNILGTLAITLTLLLSGNALASETIKTNVAPLFEKKELEAFVDDYFQKRMGELGIPGAAFAFVKDGKIELLKGFGISDTAKKTPVDPSQTVFKVGSVSKLFTTVAVLQLAERGYISLDSDVNKYLSTFKVEDKFDAPVTVWNLLTHTAGFEDKLVGSASKVFDEVPPICKHLAKEMPHRVMPPGKFYSYSNYGMSLAGCVVEQITGKSFAEYADEKVFSPLGMSNSSFAFPQRLQQKLTKGYLKSNGQVEESNFGFFNIYPAGSMISTASDMAKFMLAMLDEKTKISKPETVKLMQTRQFGYAPEFPGSCLGFYEYYRNGVRSLVHGGALPGFESRFFLVPERNIGFFVSVNMSGTEITDKFADSFLDKFFPARPPAPLPAPPDGFDARKYAGVYRFNRFNWTTFEKLLAYNTEVKVAANPDNTLTITFPPTVDTKPENVAYAKDNLFRSVDGQSYFLFGQDERGGIKYLFNNVNSAFRLSPFETSSFNISLLLASLLIFLGVLLAWPLHWLWRKIKKMRTPMTLTEKVAQVMAYMVAFVNMAFIILSALLIAPKTMDFAYGVPSYASFVLTLPVLSAVLTISLPFFAVMAVKDKHWNAAGRVFYCIAAIAALSLVWFYWYWNILTLT